MILASIDVDGIKELVAWLLGTYGLWGMGFLAVLVCLILFFRRPPWYKGKD